ncbi:MAG: diguanylate cyclase [Asticcacaulis sp.]
MGLDSHQPSSAEDGMNRQQTSSGLSEKPPRATTASMQNLLAQYFASNDFEPNSHAPASKAEVPEPAAPTIKPVSSPSSLVAQPDWPPAARTLIDSLMRENAQWREQFHQQALRLQNAQDQADSDVLTPTLNRRAFLHEVHRAMADCRRYGEEACLIYLDMDGFKSINDIYGHAAGDKALIHTAQVLNASVREGDSVGRMGGDEFAILLRHADLKSSRIKAMKLEAELMTGTFEHNGLYLKVGGSFGVRCYAAQDSAEAWVSEADAAMFLSKKSSR